MMKKDYSRFKFIFLLGLVVVLLIVAAFADKLVPFDPYEQDLNNVLSAPGKDHLLGTDRYGRDMFSRVIMGARTSVYSALLLVVIVTLAGTVAGVLAGYQGGWLDSVIMRISDVFLAFPGMVFALAIAAVMGGGVLNAVAALACVSWPKFARVARSQVLTIMEAPFIEAAKLAGSGTGKIMVKHILPNIAGPIIVMAVLDIGTMMMEIAGLSFLGLGAMPPIAEWGSMMSNGRSMLQTAPWVILAPGMAIFVTVMVFNLLGDTVRDVLDPRQSRMKSIFNGKGEAE